MRYIALITCELQRLRKEKSINSTFKMRKLRFGANDLPSAYPRVLCWGRVSSSGISGPGVLYSLFHVSQ